MKLKIQALGIVMILFGSPIIHFFRDFARVIPQSPFVMPIASVFFFGMILSLNHFKKINAPNYNISVMAWCFLGYSMFLALISTLPINKNIEFFNYAFLIIYFFLICGVSRNVAKVIIPILVIVTLIDNFALVYAFIKNPFTQLGQRAIISDVGWGEGTGNPSLYSFMAFTGIIASIILYNKSDIKWKIICLVNILSSIGVILMTLVRTTIFTLVLCAIFYVFINWKKIFAKKENSHWYDLGLSKSNFILMSIFLIIALIALFTVNSKIIANLWKYVETSYDVALRVFQTILASDEKKATNIDPSAANRVGLFNYAIELLITEPSRIIYGYGYRFLYCDIPLMQIFLEEGLIGLIMIIMFHYYVGKNVILAAQISNNSWILLLVYYYIMLAMNSISRGQPYDPYFWNYFLTIARFIKPEDMVINIGKNKITPNPALIPAIN